MSNLISRDAAIEALRSVQHRFTVADEAGGMGTVKWSEDVIYFDAAVNALSFLPSAQPELKVGKWIRKGSINESFWTCSECGQKFYQGYGNENFCPNCGKRMIKGEENENNL